MGYSFRLAARVLLYASSHRQDNTYHGLVTPVVELWLERDIAQWTIDPTTHRTMIERSYHRATSSSLEAVCSQVVKTLKIKLYYLRCGDYKNIIPESNQAIQGRTTLGNSNY